MKTFSDYYGKTLHFIQPSIWKRNFELRDGNRVIGTLIYPKFFSVRAESEIFDIKWEFYEPKWWKQIVEVREKGKELPIASYKPPVFKKQGKLDLPHGESMFLHSNFFKASYEIKDKYNNRIVLFGKKVSMNIKIEIQLEKKSELLDKHPWVLLLLLYVELNKRRRRSSG